MILSERRIRQTTPARIRCRILGHKVELNYCTRCMANFGGKRLRLRRWIR